MASSSSLSTPVAPDTTVHAVTTSDHMLPASSSSDDKSSIQLISLPSGSNMTVGEAIKRPATDLSDEASKRFKSELP